MVKVFEHLIGILVYKIILKMLLHSFIDSALFSQHLDKPQQQWVTDKR